MVEERHNEDEARRYLMEAQRLALEEKDYHVSLEVLITLKAIDMDGTVSLPRENPASFVS